MRWEETLESNLNHIIVVSSMAIAIILLLIVTA